MILQLIAQANDNGERIGTIKGIGRFVPSIANKETGLVQLEAVFSMLVGFLTVTAGLAFLIYFIIGALNWITAGGDSKKVDDAKHYMTNGAIGMIIIVAAYAIVWIVGTVLGLDILNPSETLDPSPATVTPTYTNLDPSGQYENSRTP